ncbi:MAG TPA: NAD(P)H-dependent oxidoreductase [archaeon]|nr:NAD(P)H-dependent oxidoreductase [archaeon]
MEPLNVIGVSGSNRPESMTKKLVSLILEEAKKLEAKTELIDLAEENFPLYDEDIELNKKQKELLESIEKADVLVLGSPEFHGTLTGRMKNFIDFFPYNKEPSKLCFFVSSAGSRHGGMQTINAFKTIASNLNYFSHPTSLTVGAKETAEGKITDEAVLKRINKIASEIIKWGKKFRK